MRPGKGSKTSCHQGWLLDSARLFNFALSHPLHTTVLDHSQGYSYTIVKVADPQEPGTLHLRPSLIEAMSSGHTAGESEFLVY